MQDKRGLDPHAKEFIPRSCMMASLTQHGDSKHNNTAPSSNMKCCSYRSALETAVGTSPQVLFTSATEDKKPRMPSPLKSLLDMENLLMSRRLSKPQKSVLASNKEKWMDIAHKQAVSLKNDTALSSTLSLEGPSPWHRVLSQSDAINSPSTSALLKAEEVQSHKRQVKVAERTTRTEGQQHSAYSAWWHAVLQADFVAMMELIEQHRISWDTTFVYELCSDSVRLEMAAFRESIAIFGEQDHIAEQGIEGLNALHVCSLHSHHALCLEQLVQRDAVRVHIDCHERTHKRNALHFAAWANNLEAVKILVAYGADVTLKDRNGNTSLHFATRSNNLQIVTLLCEKSRKVVNIRNKAAETPLLLTGSRSIAQVLITAGADITCRNTEGMDAAKLAARAGHSSLLEALLTVNSSHRMNRNQANANLSGTSTTAGSTSTSSKQASQNVNSTFPLHQAAQHGHTSCVKLLLSRCSSCTSSARSLQYSTGSSSGVNAGINAMHDCDMHIFEKPTNRTPLMLAAVAGHAEICALLLLHGANPAQETLHGCTALTLAAAAPSVSAVFLENLLHTLVEQQYAIEKLFADNSRRSSVLAMIALEALKHHRPSLSTPLQQLRLSVFQEYLPKFSLLVACNAPIREDFVKLFVDPACLHYMHFYSVDLRLPVEEWRQFLSNALYPEDVNSTGENLHIASTTMNVMKNGVESDVGWLQHTSRYVSLLDPPLASWGHADVRVVLCNRHGQVCEERLCHLFVLRTERCGVLKTMVESPLAKMEFIPDNEAGAGADRVVLSFSHVASDLFDLLLQWVYSGKDVICADKLMRERSNVTDAELRGADWLEEWVHQRQLTAILTLELLYLANELLMTELQELCEMHLYDLHTALPAEEVKHLIGSIHCSLFGPFYTSGIRVQASIVAKEKHCAALYELLNESTVTAARHQVLLLRHGVSVLHVFCEENDLTVPLCVTRIMHHIMHSEQRVRQSNASNNNHALAGAVKMEVEKPMPVQRSVKELLFAMHCWIQRIHLHRKMTHFDLKVVPLLKDMNGCEEHYNIEANERIYYAHRAVLAHASPKYESMIHFTESQLPRSGPQNNIHCKQELSLCVQNMSIIALEALLCFIYTGVLPCSLLSSDTDVVQDLLLELVTIADQYFLRTLSALLNRLLIQRLNEENALCFFETACLHQLNPLAAVSALFLLKQVPCSWSSNSVEERENIVDFYEHVLRYLLVPTAA